MARLQKTYEKNQTDWQQTSGLVTALDEFIQTLPATVSSYAGVAPRLGAGEDYPQAIERTRRKLRELVADKKKYATAAIPSSRAKQIVRAEIERHAELGRPDVGAVVDHGEPIRWPLSHTFKGERLLTASGDAEIDGFALVTWLFKTQLIEALEKEMDSIADDTAALILKQTAPSYWAKSNGILLPWNGRRNCLSDAPTNRASLCAAAALLIRLRF